MILILCLQILIVTCMLRASRRSLEDALPVFAFFVVLMPLESRLVIPGVCDFNTIRVSLVTLLVLYLTRKDARNYRPIPMKSLMLMHVCWAVCSTLYSIAVVVSVKQLISQVVEYYLLYFLFLRIITRRQTLYNIVFAVVMAVGLCCIFSIAEVYEQWSILRIFPANLWITYNGGLDPIYIEWGRGLRARSTFPHPILFGDALAITIPLTMYLISIWEKKWQRRLLWVVLLLMFFSIYKTSSRGPWIGLCLCCVLLFLFIRTRVRKYLTIIALSAVLLLVARPGIWETIAGLYAASTDTNSPIGTSYLYRGTLTVAIKTAVGKDIGRTLLGYGLGTFREIGLDITFLGVTSRWTTCDDNWAAFLYETGYVGVFIIGALLACPIFIALRSYRRLPRPENLFSGVLCICLLGFDFLLMSVAGYSWGQQGYLNWILISVVVVHAQLGYQVLEQEDSLVEEAQEVDQYDLSIA